MQSLQYQTHETNDLPLIVLGAGGHARVLIDTLKQLGTKVIGITDKELMKKGSFILGMEILGDDSIILEYAINSISLVNGIGSIGDLTRRKSLFTKFASQGYHFHSIFHKSAIIAPDINFGEGTQIMAGVVVQTGCYIGSNSIVNTKSSIDHSCIIGSHVHISPGVTLSGEVKIDDEVHVGTGSTIIQNISIGKKSIIGAGAVVTKDVPPGVTVIGIPAREVK